MLCFKNNLGWSLHKHIGGYVIRKAHPPARDRIVQFGPVLIHVVLLVLVLLGREMIVSCAIYTIVGLFLLLWLIKQASVRLCVSYALSALLMILSLVARSDLSMTSFFLAIPLLVFISLWFLRPVVLYINVRSGVVTGGSFFPELPAARLKIEINLSENDGVYRVFLKDTELLWKGSASEYSKWECMVWESDNEVESTKIAEKLDSWGIGTSDSQQQEEVIGVDKKAFSPFIVGYIIVVTIFILLVKFILLRNINQVKEVDSKVLLQVIQVVVAFFFFSIIPIAVYLCRLGWRMVKYKQMMPPETPITMNRKVLDRDIAKKRGKVLMAIGFVLLLLSLFGGLVFPYVLGKVYLVGS